MTSPAAQDLVPQGKDRQSPPGSRLPGPWSGIAGSTWGQLVWFWQRQADRLAWTFQAEMDQRRGFLWLPVLLGAGILIYFALPQEPVASVLIGLSVLFSVLALRGWLRGGDHYILIILTVVATGLMVAKLRVETVAAPMLSEPVSVALQGRLVEIDVRADRPPRLILDRLLFDGAPDDTMPRRVRVTIRTKGDLPEIGSRIAFQARLLPVPGAAKPGGYDPRRAAFFSGIGASGFSFSHPELVDDTTRNSLKVRLERLRARIAGRILLEGQGDAHTVAVALLVGERGYLPQSVTDNLRAAGLAHVLAISGLHMGLITGTAFFLIRALLSLFPALALRYPIHKWAAAAAILTGACYLSISGGSISTIRAFVMAAVMFGAIIAGRPALSLRNLAIAALIVLAIWPESLTQPGFQMSFASVMALISIWELWRNRQRIKLMEPANGRLSRLFGTLRKAAFGIALTTLIASLATAPFAAYHFGQFVSYSLIGNILAMPIVSLLVMPAGLLVLVLMPLGLEALPLAVMISGIDAILAISDWVAELPGAEIGHLVVPKLSLFLIAFGMIWLCLWGRMWRLLGLIPVLAGLISAPFLQSRPDILISADGGYVGVWDNHRDPTVSGRIRQSYVLDRWLGSPIIDAEYRAKLASGRQCDGSACLIKMQDGTVLSHISKAEAFNEDCDRADVIVTRLNAPKDCSASLTIDKATLAETGSLALWVSSQSDGVAGKQFHIRSAWPEIRRKWHGPTISAP